MNCVIHNDMAAVNTCKNCDGGICADCVNKDLTFYEKIMCEACFIDLSKKWIDEQRVILVKYKKIRRNLNIILILGFALGSFAFIVDVFRHDFKAGLVAWAMISAFIWGFHIFFDGSLEARFSREKSTQDQVRDGIREAQMIRDNSIFIYWAIMLSWTIFMFFFRGLFFPIFYFF